jgi:tetratricopeptide (TPR) repeat protein
VLYEALTGHAPHESNSFSELVVSVLSGQVPPVRDRRENCPAELERIILKALSRAPADRYASPREVLVALDELAAELELPRGADAFRAKDRELPYSLTPARTSIVSIRRLRSTVGKPLQLALVALVLSLPGRVVHLSGAGVETVEVASAEGTMTASGTAAVDALVERVAHVPMAVQALPPARASAEPTAELLPVVVTDEPQHVASKPLERVEVAASHALQTKPVEAKGVREPLAPEPAANELVRVEPAPVLPSPSVAPSPAEADSHSAPVALDPTQREHFDAIMRQALAALVRGQLEAAKQSYADAIKLAPREPAGYRGYGLVAARMGANQEARVALKRYLALSPGALDAVSIRERIARLR